MNAKLILDLQQYTDDTMLPDMPPFAEFTTAAPRLLEDSRSRKENGPEITEKSVSIYNPKLNTFSNVQRMK